MVECGSKFEVKLKDCILFDPFWGLYLQSSNKQRPEKRIKYIKVNKKRPPSTVHVNNVWNVCPICARILKTATVLKNHISNMHEGNIKYEYYIQFYSFL